MFRVSPNYSVAAFSDQRLADRFAAVQGDLLARPGCPLPQACQSRAALKAAYRFFAHPQTSVANLLPAFVRPSVQFFTNQPVCLVVHDTTTFNFSSLKRTKGLGFLNDSKVAKGVHLHSSLLLDGEGVLVGIGHLHFWVRTGFREEDDKEVRQLPIEEKESFKWLIGVRTCAKAFKEFGVSTCPIIHLMDREGDIHEVFAEIIALNHQAVIRCAQDRSVQGDDDEQTEAAKQRVAKSRLLGTEVIEVPLKDGGSRMAKMEVRSIPVRLRPDTKKHKGRQPLDLWLLETRERGAPPQGEQAACWRLWTMLEAKTLPQVKVVLRYYGFRWRVEDYHRMEKTGCGVEDLRLQDGQELMKVIAMQAWVATQVVGMRDAAKQNPTADCESYFKPHEWKTVWAEHHDRPWQPTDGKPPLQDVVLWLGALGGHLGRKGDGMPGAELLSRGLYALDLLLRGRKIEAAERDLLLPPSTATS